jgi:hypothetical protein
MQQGPYLIPAGAPPGTPLLFEEERPPEAVHYFRIYAVLNIGLLLCVVFGGLYMMLAPLLSGTTGASATAKWVVGLLVAGVAFALMIPYVIALFGGRKRWVHTLVLVLLAASLLLNGCCLLWAASIPMLIYWIKPETKRWYGAT